MRLYKRGKTYWFSLEFEGSGIRKRPRKAAGSELKGSRPLPNGPGTTPRRHHRAQARADYFRMR